MGAAPARHILMPLYWAGLWLAVNIAPGTSSDPAAKYSRSVEPSPASITSTPRLITPSAKARDSGTDDSRMSCAVTTVRAPLSAVTNSAKAAPSPRAMALDPEPAGDVLVPLVGYHPADVVGLDDRGELTHRQNPIRTPSSARRALGVS